MKKSIIGRVDKIDIPGLHLFDIDAKIDTGANTSAIHCHHIYTSTKNGKPAVHFKLLDPSHAEYHDKEFFFEDFKQLKVKNSFGQSEDRYVVNTKILIFGKLIETEFTLADRESMKFPVLLGRRLLMKRFVVDVAKKNLSYKNKYNKHENSSIVKKP